MSKQRYFVLVTKAQTEELSKSEKNEIDNLISTYPELIDNRDFIEKFWVESKFSMEANGDQTFHAISKEINSDQIIPLFPGQKSATKRFFNLYKIAAAIVFFLVVGIMALFVVQQTSENEKEVVLAQINQIEKTVQSGRLRVFLPDGSMVWLNSNTKLKYPETFSENERMVVLDGEAFFEVSENPEKPFVVKSGSISTKALGTSFNIRSYSSENDIRVTLVSGKVLVETDQKEDPKFILTSGFGVNYQKDKGTVTKEKIDVEKQIGWKDGILQFDNDNFQTVIKKLSRWYGVEFVLEGKFNDKKWGYSGWFKNDYLDNVLESISYSQDFEYKIENKKVTLKTKN